MSQNTINQITSKLQLTLVEQHTGRRTLESVVANTLGEPDKSGIEQLCFAFAISTDIEKLIPNHFRMYANRVMHGLERELKSIKPDKNWKTEEIELFYVFRLQKSWYSIYQLIGLLQEDKMINIGQNKTMQFSSEVKVNIMDQFSTSLNKVINELNDFSSHNENAEELRNSIKLTEQNNIINNVTNFFMKYGKPAAAFAMAMAFKANGFSTKDINENIKLIDDMI